MTKKIGIIGTGVAAVAMAAAFGFSGLMSNAATAANLVASDSAKATKTAKSDTVIMRTSGGGAKVSFQDNSGMTSEQRQALNTAVKANIKTELAALVSKGTITQEIADKLIPADKTAGSEKPGTAKSGGQRAKMELSDEQAEAIKSAMETARKNAVASMVSAGTITQEIADKVLAGNKTFVNFGGKDSVMASLTPEQMEAFATTQQANIKSALSALVSAGTITQEMADMCAPKIVKFTEGAKSGEAKPGEVKPGETLPDGAKIEDSQKMQRPEMTDAQEKAIQDAMKKANETTLSTLVANGTISQEIADKLKERGPFMMGKGHEGKMGAMSELSDTQRSAVMTATQGATKTALAGLVSKGTISQEIADALTPAAKAEKPAQGDKANKAKKPDMTDAQKEAVKTAITDANKTALAGLVQAGTITQEIADKLLDAPRLGHGMGGHVNKTTVTANA